MARRSDHSREELHAMILDAAREIVERDGLAGLTVRRIGGAIGYSSGTLYNLFDDLDDIVSQVNGVTLDAVADALAAIPPSDDPETTLRALVVAYVGFVERQPLLWSLLFQVPLTDRNRQRMERLFTLLEAALEHLVKTRSPKARRDAARVLWSGVHGMCALATEGAVLSWDDVKRLAIDLVTNYVAGLRQAG